MFEILLFLFGGICIVYDFILIIMNPGTFLDNLSAFSHIWSVLGAYLIFLGVYRKKTGHSFIQIWKKWVKKVVFVFVGIILVICTVNFCLIINPETTSKSEEADFLILLGGGIDKNGKLPKLVENRVETAAEYLILHPDVICVVTGGTLKWLPYPEAPAIKESLLSFGINEDRILVEQNALDTIQNFIYSCELLAAHEHLGKEGILASRIVVVTNRFHLRRAERLAKRMGFENILGLAAKENTISIVHMYVREICAYVKLNLRIFLTGQPAIIK